jgi:Tol biopolymer transport system component
LINVDGSGEQQLTDLEGGACQPEWSPAGTTLLFISPCTKNQRSYEGAAVYVMNPGEGQASRITSGGAGDFDPDWSPDGGMIVFTTLRNNNRAQLYFYDWQTNREDFFSLGSAYTYQADWDPNGGRLIFVSTAIGPELLFTSLLADRELTQFLREATADEKSISAPEWSNDGQTIFYTVTPQSGGFSQLYFSRVADSGFTKSLLISEGIPGRESSISVDGAWLAFESWPNTSNHDIWLVDTNGNNLSQLTSDPGNDFDAAWRP